MRTIVSEGVTQEAASMEGGEARLSSRVSLKKPMDPTAMKWMNPHLGNNTVKEERA